MAIWAHLPMRDAFQHELGIEAVASADLAADEADELDGADKAVG